MNSKKLPVVSGMQIIKILCKYGYYIRSQRGSHIVLKHPERKPVTVPDHKEIKRGLVLEIIKTAQISREEFIENL